MASLTPEGQSTVIIAGDTLFPPCLRGGSGSPSSPFLHPGQTWVGQVVGMEISKENRGKKCGRKWLR